MKRNPPASRSPYRDFACGTRAFALRCAILTVAATVALLPAQSVERLTSPYEYYDAALAVGRQGLSALRAEIGKIRSRPEPLDAGTCLKVAEMMKQLGDYGAETFYSDAVNRGPNEPAYELFWADYYRNFRGPQRPLFPAAERHYVAAVQKLQQLRSADENGAQPRIWKNWDDETQSRVQRGLVALHERDGLAIVPGKCAECSGWTDPILFVSSTDRYSAGGTELDRLADARDYTSEALESAIVLYRSTILPESTLAEIIRPKTTFDTFDRVRFRYKEAPVIDAFYTGRTTTNAKITRFDRPNEFNDVSITGFGVIAEKPFAMGRYADAYVSASGLRFDRTGLVDFQPQVKERVREYDERAAISRFLGPDKLTLESFFAYQGITSDLPGSRERTRTFAGATFTYQLFRPIGLLKKTLPSVFGRHFETRGIDLLAGYLNDNEVFLAVAKQNDVLVRRKDRFVGISFRGLGRFDITVQPTTLSAWSGREPRLNNSQYRTYVTLLARIVDEEKHPGLPEGKTGLHLAFLHLSLPFRHDIARTGPAAFENYSAGVQLSAKVFQTPMGTASYLAHIRYDRQNFYVLGRTMNMITSGLSVGF